MNLKTDYHPGKVIEFKYPVAVAPPEPPKLTRVQRSRNELVKAIHDLGQAAAEMEGLAPNRVKAHKSLESIKATRSNLKLTLADMPKK